MSKFKVPVTLFAGIGFAVVLKDIVWPLMVDHRFSAYDSAAVIFTALCTSLIAVVMGEGGES